LPATLNLTTPISQVPADFARVLLTLMDKRRPAGATAPPRSASQGRSRPGSTHNLSQGGGGSAGPKGAAAAEGGAVGVIVPGKNMRALAERDVLGRKKNKSLVGGGDATPKDKGGEFSALKDEAEPGHVQPSAKSFGIAPPEGALR
jgi:hypothetical protein